MEEDFRILGVRDLGMGATPFCVHDQVLHIVVHAAHAADSRARVPNEAIQEHRQNLRPRRMIFTTPGWRTNTSSTRSSFLPLSARIMRRPLTMADANCRAPLLFDHKKRGDALCSELHIQKPGRQLCAARNC